MNTSFLNKSNITLCIVSLVAISSIAVNIKNQQRIDELENTISEIQYQSSFNAGGIEGLKQALIKEKKDINKKMEIVLQEVKKFTEILEESNNKQVKDTLSLAVTFGRFKESVNSMLETDKSIFNTMKIMIDNIEELQSDVSKLKKVYARKTGIKNSR